jgi:hypothetical protein
MTNTQTNRQKFETTYSYVTLIKKHKLDEQGIWEIRGEDPNCDFGGSHHQPYLNTVEGALTDVIDHAVGLVGFWGWGAGGDIVKRSPTLRIPPNMNKKREETRKEIATLEQKIAQLKNIL